MGYINLFFDIVITLEHVRKLQPNQCLIENDGHLWTLINLAITPSLWVVLQQHDEFKWL